ncbi:MAG: HEAT repeat domain-containing protein [Pseudomonadota bacterium]
MKQTIKDLLNSEDGNLRKMGLTMAIFHNLKGVERDVLQLMDDRDSTVRSAALEQLAKLKGSESSGPIARIAADEAEKPSNRYFAVKALIEMDAVDRIKGNIGSLLAQDSHSLKMEAMKAALKTGEEGLYEDLLSVFYTGEFDLCEAAAKTIAGIKRCDGQELYELFVLLLEEEDEAQRYGAVVGLGEIADPRSIPKIAPMLTHYIEKEDDRNAVRMLEAIADTLGNIGTERVLTQLIILLKSGSVGVRAKAAVALGRTGSKAAELSLKRAYELLENKSIKEHLARSMNAIRSGRPLDEPAPDCSIGEIEIDVSQFQDDD